MEKRIYSVGDYTFSDKKRLNRRVQFEEIGLATAELASLRAVKYHGCEEAVIFRTGRLDSVIATYFRKVAEFKCKHRFPPNIKINPPKMAAIMIASIFEEHDTEPLFSIPEGLVGADFSDSVLYDFVYSTLVYYLKIDVKKVEFNVKRDLIECLDFYEIDTEWLAWAMHNFCMAYGEMLKIGE